MNARREAKYIKHLRIGGTRSVQALRYVFGGVIGVACVNFLILEYCTPILQNIRIITVKSKELEREQVEGESSTLLFKKIKRNLIGSQSKGPEEKEQTKKEPPN